LKNWAINGADKFIAKICKKFIIILLIMGNCKQSIFLSTTSNIWSKRTGDYRSFKADVTLENFQWQFTMEMKLQRFDWLGSPLRCEIPLNIISCNISR
jgi:hypothetical protein